MRHFVLLVVLAITIYPLVSASAQLVDGDIPLEELFQYADLVAEGVIENIEKVTVSWADIHPELSEHDVSISIMDFRVDAVLVGYQKAKHIEVVAYNLTTSAPSHFDFNEGDKYILSLKRPTTGKLFEAERYLVRSDYAKFHINGSKWIQGEKSNPMAEGQLKELYGILENIQRERSIEQLAEKAEFIVRGKILDVWDSNEKTAKGRDKHITRVKLTVQSVMKGAIDSGSIIVSMIGRGGYQPSWRASVPANMQVGEEWIMFLKSAEEPGFYPFAGVNGLFLVEGDLLIRNNNSRIILHFSPEQLVSQVKQAVLGNK